MYTCFQSTAAVIPEIHTLRALMHPHKTVKIQISFCAGERERSLSSVWPNTSETFKYINQQDTTVSQVYYLTFMCGSTCSGRLRPHHQERTTALGASGFTVGEKRLEHCWSWSARPRPTTLQPLLSKVKTRGSQCSCTLMMMGGETPETC